MTIWQAYWTLVNEYKYGYKLKYNELERNIGRVYNPRYAEYTKEKNVDMHSIYLLAKARGVKMIDIINEIKELTK